MKPRLKPRQWLKWVAVQPDGSLACVLMDPPLPFKDLEIIRVKVIELVVPPKATQNHDVKP